MVMLEKAVLNALEEIKAENINNLNVESLTTITSNMIIATGTSTTHVKAITDKIIKEAKKINIKPFGIEGIKESEWVLIDLGEVIVHVMLSATREFYKLEKLWTPIEEIDEELIAISA